MLADSKLLRILHEQAQRKLDALESISAELGSEGRATDCDLVDEAAADLDLQPLCPPA